MQKLNPTFICYPSVELLQTMIKTKRKEILRFCGFTESTQMVKIISKISIDGLNIKLLIQLKDIIMTRSRVSERIMQILSFTKRINKNLIHLVSANNFLLSILTDKLVFEIINDEQYSVKSSMLLQMYQDSKSWKIRIPGINSLANLDIIKKKFDEQVERKRHNLENFPLPPFEDNEYVKAIRKEKELISWSKRQNNCIRTCANKVRTGKSYFYRVCNNFEEATLEIKKIKDGFRQGDLLGLNNCAVSAELAGIVNSWLKENRANQKTI